MLSPSPIGGLSFRIAAVMICVTCIFYMTVMRSYNRKRLRGRLFIVLLVLTVIDCCTGIISTLISNSGASERAKDIVTYVCKFVYYLTHMAFTPVLAIYITIVCDVFHKFTRKSLTLVIMPFLLLELGVLSNPWTNFIYAQASHQFYTRGKGVYVAYTISAIYVAMCVILLLRYWHSMNQLQKVAMFYFLLLSLAGTLVQMLYPKIVCELMAEALGLMGIMIMIERDDYRLDYKTHANNRSALMHDLNSYIEYGRHFYIICCRIDNAENYRRLMGSDTYDDIMFKTAEFLRSLDGRYETYRTTGGIFYTLCPEATKSDVDRILAIMEEVYEKSFSRTLGIARVNAKVLCGRCPEEFQTVNDILLMGDTELDGTEKLILRGHDLDFLLKKVEIENSIVRGLNGDSFEVKYQPAYDKKNHVIYSTEALLTLNDPGLGEISFADFMVVADETGFVEEMQYRMLESVFAFASEAVVREQLDIKAFIVHVMSVQVLKHDLIDKINYCIDKYEIDHSLIIFSISDTIAIQAQGVLETMLEALREKGMYFFLAIHDAGFPGLSPEIINKFIGIVINVRRQYEESDREQAEILIKNRISMVKELGKIVVLIGVDNKELYDCVKDMPVEIICGNYLSPMVSKKELKEKFVKKEMFFA